MWVHAGKVIRVGRSWTSVDGIKHPYNWNNWTEEEKKAAGLVNDTSLDPTPYDSRFYWGWNADKTSLIEKNIADVNEVDDDGKPILDDDGNQVVTLGLKSVAITRTKEKAGSILSKSDWYITRQAEAGTPIPSTVGNYRTAVRNKCKTIEDAINACDTLAKFIALYDTPMKDGKPTNENAPINDWPDEI